jgi:hypothetical protein
MTDTKSSSLANTPNQLLPQQATSSVATTTTLMKLDDTIDTLGQKSQSLLRTMRLDTVLLSAQHEESRSILNKLEADWIMLQSLLDEQRRKAKAENNSNEVAADDDDDQNNEQQEQQKAINTQFRRNSSIEWSEGGLESSERQQQQHQTLHSLNLSDSNPNNSSRSNNNNNNNKKSLDDSNFDWGQEDDDNDELQRVDRMADQSEPLTLDTILNSSGRGSGDQNKEENDLDDLPPVRRMFGFGRRGDDENGKNNNKRRDKSNNNNNNKVFNKEPDTPSSLSSSLFGSGRPSFLGGSGRRRQLDRDDDASSVTMGSVNSFSWHGLFRRDGTTKKTDEEKKKNAVTDVDLSNSIATMQVKLRGCDAAASSLQQLVSYQKRQIVDLKCERDRLKLTSEFESLCDQSELDLLRKQVEQAQMERRRKIRLLKEAEDDKMNAIDREERLKEELECVRMELFMLSNNTE